MMNRNILHPMMFETPTPTGEGVYHSTELGLISLSVDGTTWYTIADKNLGASSLGGNGLYYQRGNNYGFGSGNYVWQQRVDATNYGPYYDDEVFRNCSVGLTPPAPWFTPTSRWDSSKNTNLRGNTTDTFLARKGPCPEGFHVPTYSEYLTLRNVAIYQGIDVNTGEWVMRYLKMPMAGRIINKTAEYERDGGYYWCSNCRRWSFENVFVGNIITFTSDSYNYSQEGQSCSGYSIRPFKNEPITPDSSWIQLHSGFYWNPDLQLISIQKDAVSWITIADRNLGATQVYEYGDELIAGNCGGFFQYGNNHMFPYDGTFQTNTSQVNASNYGPYYYSSDFIGTTSLSYTYNWSSVTNKNLWGGITNTDIAKRGPCPEGFHIPTMLEESEFERNLGILGGSISTIYMPKTGLMYPNMSVYDKSWRGVWTSQRAEGGDTPYFRGNFHRSYGAGRGMQIRPFKNTPIVPDSTRTKLL